MSASAKRYLNMRSDNYIIRLQELEKMSLPFFLKRIINFRRGTKKTPEILKQEQQVTLFEETLKEWTKAKKIRLDWTKFNELVDLRKQIESIRPGISLLDVDKLHEKYNHDNPGIPFPNYVQNLIAQTKRV